MPRFWIDCTTSFQEQGRHPHGTTRVERGIVGAFAGRDAPRVGFVRFERAAGRFHPVSAAEAAEIAAAPAVADRGRERAGVWRRRAWAMQGRVLRLFKRPAASPGEGADHPFAPGDTIFFPGEHDRHDFAGLTRLKRDKALRFAFLFYDLLATLPDDDPRLRDPATGDLPQTDFIVREADLILPISRFSEGALRAHLRRRGIAGPPIQTVRLAGSVPKAGEGTPVPGLLPSRFVLSVGDVVHRKNHALLARVWAELGETAPVLAIVGRIDLEGNELVGTVRRDRALRDKIRFLPNLDDDALLWLYRNCGFTVFPSFLEGFGLPVAESLAYGKVCVASSASAIPEAGQGCAISLDPHDPAVWIATIRRLADDPTLRAEEARVRACFRPVSWNDTVDDILSAMAPHGVQAGAALH